MAEKKQKIAPRYGSLKVSPEERLRIDALDLRLKQERGGAAASPDVDNQATMRETGQRRMPRLRHNGGAVQGRAGDVRHQMHARAIADVHL